jgi:glycosyltransferase involved in cell wall biosynthesis
VSSVRLTICIPTFDRLGYLREAVASARAQTLRDIEILIGDDGDSPELRSWCLSQSAEDPRVRYEKTPGRLRLAGNWNFLAGRARAEYVTLMGDDDRLLPSFAERLIEMAQTTAQAPIAVVFANHYMIDTHGERLINESHETTRRYGRARLRDGVVERVQSVVWGNAIAISASIVRREDVVRLGFKNDINTPELELFARMASQGARFAFVNDYLAEYRTHLGSETSSGLTIDRLAEYLEVVDVPSEVEPAKRQCLQAMLVRGVGIRLGRGDVEGARSLRDSRYYPRTLMDARVWAQRLILTLPDSLVPPVYASLRRLDRSVRGDQ